MTAPGEGARPPEQATNDRNRQAKWVEALAAGVREQVRKHSQSNAAKLRAIHDVWEMPEGSSLHLKSEGYMDLVVESLAPLRVSLSHYGKQNGDLMADPDMEVLLAPDRSWVRPVSYQNDYVGVYQSVEDVPNPDLERELNEFLGMWLDTLAGQGFGRPSPEEARRRAKEREEHISAKVDYFVSLRGPEPEAPSREQEREPEGPGR